VLTLAVSLGTLLLGALIGFFFRRREFEREQRLHVYGEFVATFLEAVQVGAGGESVYLQLGPTMDTEPTYAEMRSKLFDRWSKASLAFEAATARLRLIASDRVRTESEKVEIFLRDNVRGVATIHSRHRYVEVGRGCEAEPGGGREGSHAVGARVL
jgi:hypothetical protein